MYYPYFRGKQFELLAIRDTANVMAEAGFTPIIEPVREALNGLERTYDWLFSARVLSSKEFIFEILFNSLR
nr:sce7725 family protein [Citrobacter freundii]